MTSLKEYLINFGINFEEKDGAITVGGGLDLSCTNITSLPDNLTVGATEFKDFFEGKTDE